MGQSWIFRGWVSTWLGRYDIMSAERINGYPVYYAFSSSFDESNGEWPDDHRCMWWVPQP